MRSRSLFLACVLTALAVGTGTAAGAASPAGPPPIGPSPVGPPPVGILDPDAHPALTWSVPSRYDTSWSAWNSRTAHYDPAIINPATWSVNVNACASTSARPIAGYVFAVAQSGTSWTRTFTSPSCSLALVNVLPAQGTYAVTVTLHTSVGLSLPLRRTIGIRDYLIVSMGDSIASGEGNPDVAGSYDVSYAAGIEVDIHTRAAAVWKDTRCHRSARSGPALAAKSLEDADPYTSVTFVSVACSGAQLSDLSWTRYGGVSPDGVNEPPQVDAVGNAIGGALKARTIDALLISAGVNDLGFSDIIKACATNLPDDFGNDPSCVTDGGIADKLAGLPAKYFALAVAISKKLPSTREVYVNDYPSSELISGACDNSALDLPPNGITSDEGAAMAQWGDSLATVIANAGRSFRHDPFRWNVIDGLASDFLDHPYCSSVPWVESYGKSWDTQGDENGTVHPNALGTAAYAARIRGAVALAQVSTPYRRLTVTLNALKVPALAGGTPVNVDRTLFEYQNDFTGVTRSYSIPRNGQWTSIPSGTGTFYLDVYPEPSSPRHATGLHVGIGHILGITGTLTNSYAAGHHVEVHPTGALGVDYTVTVTAPPGQ